MSIDALSGGGSACYYAQLQSQQSSSCSSCSDSAPPTGSTSSPTAPASTNGSALASFFQALATDPQGSDSTGATTANGAPHGHHHPNDTDGDKSGLQDIADQLSNALQSGTTTAANLAGALASDIAKALHGYGGSDTSSTSSANTNGSLAITA